MRRPVLPLIAVVLAALSIAACQTTPAVPDVADPREILRRSVTAMGETSTVRFAGSASGTVRADILATGSPVDVELEGSTVRGDLDMVAGASQVMVRVPGMLGLNVELISLRQGTWFKSNLTGGRYQRLDGGAGPGQIGETLDPRTALAALEQLLAMPGIATTKLEDARCGDRPCYQVRLDVRPGDLAAPSATRRPAAGSSTAPAAGPIAITLGIDKETFRLGRVLVGSDDDELGSFDVTIELSRWNEPVTIEPPPAAEVDPG